MNTTCTTVLFFADDVFIKNTFHAYQHFDVNNMKDDSLFNTEKISYFVS